MSDAAEGCTASGKCDEDIETWSQRIKAAASSTKRGQLLRHAEAHADSLAAYCEVPLLSIDAELGLQVGQHGCMCSCQLLSEGDGSHASKS